MERKGKRAIMGRSVHNQRIERLWRDVKRGVLLLFKNLFNEMHEHGILQDDNDAHMWLLHFVFVPIIQSKLDLFMEQYNRHTLRTEHNKTPMQLYVSGQLKTNKQNPETIGAQASNYDTQLDESESDENTERGALSRVNTDIPCPFTPDQVAIIHQEIKPLETASIGWDKYVESIELIHNRF